VGGAICAARRPAHAGAAATMVTKEIATKKAAPAWGFQTGAALSRMTSRAQEITHQ
jgi:hypothetical protein